MGNIEVIGIISIVIVIYGIYRYYKKDTIPLVINQEKHKVKKIKSKIEESLGDIRKEREELIKEREKNEPRFEENDKEVKCIFKGKTFLFDKEGYRFFNDEFIVPWGFEGLSVINNYLAIDHPANDWVIWFHRKFMRIEIEKFCLENNCTTSEVVIHHIDFSTTNNKKENLRVMLVKNHNKLHHRDN